MMVEWTPNRTGKQSTINLTKVLQLYSWVGFNIHTVLMDMMLEKVRNLLPQVNMNMSTTNERVAKIERRIGMVKECCGGILAMLPFSYLPQ